MSDLTKKFKLPDINFLALFKKKSKPKTTVDGSKDVDSKDKRNYFNPALKGKVGYPTLSTIKVFINTQPFTIPNTDNKAIVSFSPREKIAIKAFQRWQSLMVRCGKPLVLVGTPEEANIRLLYWKFMSDNYQGETVPISNTLQCDIYANIYSYEMSDEKLLELCMHEIGHGLGLPHSDNENDLMHSKSPTTEFTQADINTTLMTFGKSKG